MRILRCQVGVNCMTCDSKYIICGLLNKNLAIYDRSSLDLVQNLSGHTDHIWSVDLTKELIVSGSWDSTVKLWNKKNWKILDTYSDADQKEISGVKFSLNQDYIYVSCLSGTLTVLKLEHHKLNGNIFPALGFLTQYYPTLNILYFSCQNHTLSARVWRNL